MIATGSFKNHFHNAHRSAKKLEEGHVSSDLPTLEKADPHVFAMCAYVQHEDRQGWRKYSAGAIEAETTAQSVSKIINEALVRQLIPNKYSHLVGSGCSDHGYNDAALDEEHRPVNGMINFGAIANCILLHDELADRAEPDVLNCWRDITGERMHIDEQVFREDEACLRRGDYDAHRETFYGENTVGKKLAETWNKHGVALTNANVDAGMKLFLRFCSIRITVDHLAKVGAVFANDGVHPLTHPQTAVFAKPVAEAVTGSMSRAGMYAESASIADRTNGIPCKSGISGAVVAHSGGRMPAFGFGSYSPRLSLHGNSLRGVAALEYLSRQIELPASTQRRNRSQGDT